MTPGFLAIPLFFFNFIFHAQISCFSWLVSDKYVNKIIQIGTNPNEKENCRGYRYMSFIGEVSKSAGLSELALKM